MRFKRPASCLTLGMLFSLTGLGCAAFDAMVSGPPPKHHVQPSTERLTAIARVFENQGNLSRAESMYRLAMRQDPSNDFARERVEYIAALQHDRNATAQPVTAAVAAADNIEVRGEVPQGKPRMAEPVASRTSPKPQLADAGRIVKASASHDTQSSARPAAETKTAAAAETKPEETEFTAAVESSAAEPDTAVAAPEIEIAAAEQAAADDQAAETENTESAEPDFAEVAAAEIKPVILADLDQAMAETESAAVTQVGHTVVTLDEVAVWMDAPAEHATGLVSALEAGEDPGVQALAAALLADCQAGDQQIDEALTVACGSQNSLVRATARDSLIRRGALDRSGVRDLLELLSDNDAEIRSQAAASLRHFVGSEWSAECVAGLAELLSDLNPSVRAMAAATLGDFAGAGPTADDARQLLQDAEQTEQNQNVRNAIAVSLERNRFPYAEGSGVGPEEELKPLPFVE